MHHVTLSVAKTLPSCRWKEKVKFKANLAGNALQHRRVRIVIGNDTQLSDSGGTSTQRTGSEQHPESLHLEHPHNKHSFQFYFPRNSTKSQVKGKHMFLATWT